MRRWATAIAASAALVVAAGCSTGTSGSGSSGSGHTVTFALPAGTIPTYISPFVAGPVSNNVDLFQFSPFMWRPLYWFGINGTVNINYSESMAGAPTYSNGGKTVTVTLNKKFTWSNGKPVTNRDVEFWLNLLKNEKGEYLGYSPGSIPDDIASMSFPASSPYQFSITFNKVYSPLWILYDELSEIVPIPQAVWDKTSASSPVGNYDTTAAGAKAVWKFMNSQATQEGTYTTNKIWQVVDGPWNLTGFSTVTGASTFTPNKAYTGPGKPKIAKFEELPFTSTSAEFNALRSGQVDFGYLPPEDASQASYFTSRGYTVNNWTDYGFNGMLLNFTNPTGRAASQAALHSAGHAVSDQPAANLQGHLARLRVPDARANSPDAQDLLPVQHSAAEPLSVQREPRDLTAEGTRMECSAQRYGHLRQARNRADAVRGRDCRRSQALHDPGGSHGLIAVLG